MKDLLQVGCIAKDRNRFYRVIHVNGKRYQAHRLAFLMVNGDMPASGLEVDHIDGDGTNNKFDNLRLVEGRINQRNKPVYKESKSGFAGVRYVPERRGRRPHWHARIVVDRKHISLGCFQDMISAVAARIAANKIYGFTDRHGR